MSDRDRDDLTDRADLAGIIMQGRRVGEALGSDEIADAILAAGWVHWPLHPTVDKLTAALNDERELHRDTRAENAELRRRLVEAGALDPAEAVGE